MFGSTWSLRMFLEASTKSSRFVIEVKLPILLQIEPLQGAKDSKDKNIEREDPVRPCARLQSKLPAFARHSRCGSPPIIARAVIERRVDI